MIRGRMRKRFVDSYMSKYEDIRETLTEKRRSFFGKYEIFVISDGKKTVSVKAGKGLGTLYPIGCRLTVGHIGRQMINIRPGIVYGDEGSFAGERRRTAPRPFCVSASPGRAAARKNTEKSFVRRGFSVDFL